MPNPCKRRQGQDHPKANLTDREVDRMRVMHEEYPVGHAQHLGYRQLGTIFGISRYTARNHCKYRRRS